MVYQTKKESNYSNIVIDKNELISNLMQYLDYPVNIDISLFSVFQGYPYVSTNPKLGFLNIYAIGGARIVKPDAYYITEESRKKLYHKSSCKKIVNATSEVKSQVYGSRQECALQGAYPCPDCRP